MKRRLRKIAFLKLWGKALVLGVLGLAISNPVAIAAPRPLGPPIGGSLPPTTVKPKPRVQPKPSAEAPPVQAPAPVQRSVTRPTGGYGQPVGGLDTSADRDTTMFGKAEDSYGIEMSLWPEDMEVSQGLLQWRVNIVRFSPLVSELYRTPVRPDGFVTGIGKVSATMVLNQDGTCTSVLNLASNPVARIQVACSRGPGFMFRVLKPPRTTRWIAIAAVFRETEGMPTVVREYLVDMRTKAVWPVTDFSTEGFVVGECSGEAKILWNSDAARRLGLRVKDCLRTDYWPSDDGRLTGRPQPYEQAAARPQNPAPVRPVPTPRPDVAQAPAEETAAWIRSYRDSYLSGETNASAKSLARVRDLPTSDGSRVLRELAQGDSAKGRWVQGRDPTTRWLKLSDTNGYVWEGNLSETGNNWPLPSGGTWRMPIDGADAHEATDGDCGDWKGVPNACVWFSNQSRDSRTIWRDVNPFQRHENPKGYHLGADLNLGSKADDKDLPVRAVAAGEVLKVFRNVAGWGNAILVKHQTSLGPITTLYAHVSWLPSGPPMETSKVENGEKIALIGNGSWSPCSSPNPAACQYPYHLHFEVRKGASADLGPGYTKTTVTQGPQGQIDPIRYLKESFR